MAQIPATKVFRNGFKTIDKDSLRWFPGHMEKGLKQMQHKLRSVDCIIEVHDARIPLSGRNVNFKRTIGGIKPHILVLNKVDTIDSKLMPKIKERLRIETDNVIFTNCKNHRDPGVKRLFPLAQELIDASDRYNRANEEDFCIMMIGIPNVGKSSLVNCLRNRFLSKGNASSVGAAPGITRSVLTKIKMSEKPLFYLLDTPGILTPSIDNVEVGLKMALCNTILDHLVGENVMADYLLYWLNKQKKFYYVKKYKLKEASDDVLSLLTRIAINERKMLKLRDSGGDYVLRPDLDNAAKVFVRDFRNGDLGKIMLDEDVL